MLIYVDDVCIRHAVIACSGGGVSRAMRTQSGAGELEESLS